MIEVFFPRRLDVVGTPISSTSIEEVIAFLGEPRRDRATVVAVCNVHSVMSARRSVELRTALDRADVATPDGMPLVWAIRALHQVAQERVAGPDLMAAALARPDVGPHFLYGGADATLNRLTDAIASSHPLARIAGTLSPPFGPLSSYDLDGDCATIRGSGARVVWVGLGMPKQELWMNAVADRLPDVCLVGVGAAFDFLAGTVRRAPKWAQRSGLEWAFRLTKEPRRLWRRYAWNNPAFLVSVAWEFAKKASRHAMSGT
jgi:N-acetylglucosaminyldiphosphoundecaprenol N-acetyl-beta-D-mannosaminyltransferase